MYYSITFESVKTGRKKNTWEDWYLIPSSPPVVTPPEVYTNIVEIPGREKGPLDLSEVLSGKPTYLNSEGDWEFIYSKEYCEKFTRVEIVNEVKSFLHGQRMKVTLEEDTTQYYTGRLSLSEVKVGASFSSLTIHYVLEPIPNAVKVPTQAAPDDYTAGEEDDSEVDVVSPE